MDKQSMKHPYDEKLFDNEHKWAIDLSNCLEKPQNIIWSGRRQSQKVINCTIPFVWSSKSQLVITE
jgi:hypothetical protein